MQAIDLSKVSILVADPNRFMRDVVRNALQGLGVRNVIDASDGAEALAQFKGHGPDIVILELVLPVLDGIEVLRMLRNKQTSPNSFVPVIMLTAHGERENVLKAREAGVSGYLVKPVSPRALQERIVACLSPPKGAIGATPSDPSARRASSTPMRSGDTLHCLD